MNERTLVSANGLPPALANKVDALIKLFNDAPVMTERERNRTSRRHRDDIFRKVVDEGMDYRQASEQPELYNRDGESFFWSLEEYRSESGLAMRYGSRLLPALPPNWGSSRSVFPHAGCDLAAQGQGTRAREAFSVSLVQTLSLWQRRQVRKISGTREETRGDQLGSKGIRMQGSRKPISSSGRIGQDWDD